MKENLLGKRFSSLIVIAEAPPQNGRTSWLCRCDCGREKIILASNLKRGLTRTCGCVRLGERTRLVGQRFGRLVAIECVGVTANKDTLWKCLCDCGNEIVVQNNNLKSGHTTSCGCKKEEIQKNAEYRVEGLKKSPNTGRFETNVHAKNWILTAPNGTIYKFRNLSLFIRNNPELFDSDGSDENISKIVKSLSGIKSTGQKWHGWTAQTIDDV